MTVNGYGIQKSYSFPQTSSKIKFNPQSFSTKCSNLANLANTILQPASDSESDNEPKIQVKISPVDKLIQQLKIADEYEKQIKTIQSYGFKKKEIKILKNFYNVNADYLNTLRLPAFVSRENIAIRFSVVLIPNSYNRKGIYALLKTHTLLKEINFGTYNRVTWALNLETFNLHVFRSAKLKHVPLAERQINDILSDFPQYFVTGDKVQYWGNWRERSPISEPLPQENSEPPPQENVEKIGFIMDYEGKDLWVRLNNRDKIISDGMAREVSEKLATTIAFLHQLKIVHGDPKPENIFFSTDRETVKLGDFGYSAKIGEIRSGVGTPGYTAPEISVGFAYKADPKTDIWGMGGVFADLYRTGWTKWWGEVIDEDKWQLMTNQHLERAKDNFFPHRKNSAHPHFIINQCLQLNPKFRPSAYQIALMWRKLKTTDSAI